MAAVDLVVVVVVGALAVVVVGVEVLVVAGRDKTDVWTWQVGLLDTVGASGWGCSR